MIQVDETIRDRLRLMARPGETDDLVLQRLIRYIEEEDLEEIIEARWESCRGRRANISLWKRPDAGKGSSQG